MQPLDLFLAITLAVLPWAAQGQTPAAASSYQLLNTSKVGGEGGFDYVYADTSNRRLYIPRTGPAGKVRSSIWIR